MTATVLGLWGTWSGWGAGRLDPPTSNKGTLVESFCTEVSSSGSFSIYAWMSLLWLNFSFKVSDIAFLHMSSGLMESCSGISSCVILVRDGGGGVDTRSTTFLVVEVFELFDLFGQPCCTPASTNLWNWVSTGTLFATASSIMSHDVAASSS